MSNRTEHESEAAPRAETAIEVVPTVKIGELDVARLDFQATLGLLGEWLDGNTPRQVATANLDFLELTSRDAALREALAGADIITADGEPLVWLSRMLGKPCAERVAGSDLIMPLIGEAARRDRSVYLLGAAPGVGAKAAEVMCARHPELRIAGVSSPMVDLDDDSYLSVVDEVRESGADLLVVAFGAPKQDIFLDRHLHELGCTVGIGVGATLDFIAGRVQRAPVVFQKLALEWLFRFGLEPRRLGARYARDAGYLAKLALDIKLGHLRERSRRVVARRGRATA